jgi:putative tryptophan/tyrosine transport system substrate-binding protein
MRRREFIAFLGGATAAWPLAAGAQQSDQLRRIGYLSSLAETDLDGRTWDSAFRMSLTELGWIEGRNAHVDYRWADGKLDRLRAFATELVGLKPEVIFAVSTPATAAAQAATRMIPTVFAVVSDPIGSKFVASMANPGGNITGFMYIEASMSGKWLELMRQIMPQVARVGMLYNLETAPYARYFLEAFHSAASILSIEAIDAPFHSAADLEPVMAKLAGQPNAGLVVMPDTSTTLHRSTIIALADRYRLLTIYPFRNAVAAGGLISYGANVTETVKAATTYVDRILHGAKPNELPVQLPTKFELYVNLNTAKALGLTMPQSILATADEVIE